MKSILLTISLLFSVLLSAQNLELEGKVYGTVVSSMYKEAKLSKPVDASIFHGLTTKYPNLKIFFRNSKDFRECMQSYGSVVHWELSTEEERNLRIHIKRNGGRMPKYKPLAVALPVEEKLPEAVEPVEEKVSIEVAVQEEPKVEPVTIEERAETEIIFSKDSIVLELVVEEPEKAAPVDSELKIPVNQNAVHQAQEVLPRNVPMKRMEVKSAFDRVEPEYGKEIVVAGPMTYRNRKIIMKGETISLKKAKKLAKNASSRSLYEFRKARRLRSWNLFYTYIGIASVSVGMEDSSPTLLGVGVGMAGLIGVQEDHRIQSIKRGVNEYNRAIEVEK